MAQKYEVDYVDHEKGITYYKDGSYSVDISRDSPSYKKWQKDREERVFPAYKEKLRKDLITNVHYGLAHDLGSYYKIDLQIACEVFPEEIKMLQNLLNSLGNKLNTNEKQYPTNL